MPLQPIRTLAGLTQESPILCTIPVLNGNDVNGNPTYPPECNYTLSFPRFALSDGQRLFISDSGNDRVLIFEQVPTQNAQAADIVIGQLGGDINQAYDGVDSLRTPGSNGLGRHQSLTWPDTYNRRINVYSPTQRRRQRRIYRRSQRGSLAIYAVGSLTIALISGDTITAGNLVSLVVGNTATNAATCTSPTPTVTKYDFYELRSGLYL